MEDLEDNNIVTVTFVDQSAAFDVSDHKIILEKLKLLGLTNVDWVSSYLSGRSQSTSIGASLSAPMLHPAASVVQGGVGSGIMYNVMTCDLTDVIHTEYNVSLEDTEHHCKVDGDLATFVDDASLYFGRENPAIVTSVTDKNMKAIEEYMHTNKLKINSDKTHLLVMCKNR